MAQFALAAEFPCFVSTQTTTHNRGSKETEILSSSLQKTYTSNGSSLTKPAGRSRTLILMAPGIVNTDRTIQGSHNVPTGIPTTVYGGYQQDDLAHDLLRPGLRDSTMDIPIGGLDVGSLTAGVAFRRFQWPESR